MDRQPDHDTLQAALDRCGAGWTAAQSHGLLAGRLAVAGRTAGAEWLGQVLDGVDTGNALRAECENLLSATFDASYRQLSERLSEFQPLIPDDAENALRRTTALAHWCEGFLHGLVTAKHEDALKQRIAEDPLADIIRDMLQITRATVGEEDEEGNEAAFAELVEYVRVAAQLAYEELADIRNAAGGPESGDSAPDTLH